MEQLGKGMVSQQYTERLPPDITGDPLAIDIGLLASHTHKIATRISRETYPLLKSNHRVLVSYTRGNYHPDIQGGSHAIDVELVSQP